MLFRSLAVRGPARYAMECPVSAFSGLPACVHAREATDVAMHACEARTWACMHAREATDVAVRRIDSFCTLDSDVSSDSEDTDAPG